MAPEPDRWSRWLLERRERERLLSHLEREITDGTPVRRTAVAFLAAAKPG